MGAAVAPRTALDRGVRSLRAARRALRGRSGRGARRAAHGRVAGAGALSGRDRGALRRRPRRGARDPGAASRGSRSMRPLAPAVFLIAASFHGVASAQDFAAPAPAGPGAGGATLIERALPDPVRSTSLEALAVQWGGLADFTTRAAVAAS